MMLNRKAVDAFLNRKLDDHRWIKKLSKDQLWDEARRLKVRPIFRTDPWAHQLAVFWLCLHYPQFMAALTMGAGKTKIIADVLTQLIRERRVKRGLVIVPRQINVGGWDDDLYEHSDLEPHLVDVTEIKEKRERFFNPRGDLTIVDVPSLQWILCNKEVVDKKKGKGKLVIDRALVNRAADLYGDFLAIDETHLSGKPNTVWYEMLRMLADQTDRTIGATGTMLDRNLEEAWQQMRLVDGGQTFGEKIGLFRAGYMSKEVKPWKGEVWTALPSMAGEFQRALQHRSINYEEVELFDLPQRQYVQVQLRMGEEQREHYFRAVDGVINAGGTVGELDSAWLRMRQVTSGYLRWKDMNGEHKIEFADNPKLNAMERILCELGGKKIVVCCDYIETGQLIVQRLQKMGITFDWLYGETKDPHAVKRAFMEKKQMQVLLANPVTVGTGTDGLQKVCHYMMFYESPTPPKRRLQTEKRIHRPGMGDQRPYIYDLVCKGTVDAGILDGHREGYDFYERFMSGKTRGQRSILRA